MQDPQTIENEIDDELALLENLIKRFEGRRDHNDERGVGETAAAMKEQMQRCHITVGGYLSDGMFSKNKTQHWTEQLQRLQKRVNELVSDAHVTPARTPALALI